MTTMKSVVFVVVLIASCHGNRRNSVQFEEIKDLIGSVQSQLSTAANAMSKVADMDTRLLLLTSKLDRLLESVDLIKTNDRLVLDKLSKMEGKMDKFEEMSKSTMTEVNVLARATQERMDAIEQNIDSKVKKVLNVASNTYEETKSLRASFDGGQKDQSGRFIPFRPPPSEGSSIDVLGRGLKEQLTIHNYEVLKKVSSVEETSMKLMAYLDTIESHQLILNDNFVTFSDSLSEKLRQSRSDSSTEAPSNVLLPLNSTLNSSQNLTYWHSKLEYSLDKRNENLMQFVQKQFDALKPLLNRLKCSNNDSQPREVLIVQSAGGIRPSLSPVIVAVDIPASPTQKIGPTSKPECTTSKIFGAPSCTELQTKGEATCDGRYVLVLKHRALHVACDMSDAPGGWTVLMRRGQFSNRPERRGRRRVSFEQDWESYKHGFGDLDDEFWMGNENIYGLTSNPDVTLRVDLVAFDGDSVTLDYERFKLEPETDGYRLIIGDFSGPQNFAAVASSFLNHNGSQFSASDRDLSRNLRENCPRTFRAGFWFDKLRCSYALLTGPYFGENELPPEGSHEGIRWASWKANAPLKAVQLKIRTRTLGHEP